MSLKVLKAGLQTTLQGAPFAGHRHLGMPAAGAADCLSLALANFLVGKEWDAVAIEIALTDARFETNQPCTIGVVGGAEFVRINDIDQPPHRTLNLVAGDTIHIGPSHSACRTYLATRADLVADRLLGGKSTYLAAGLGGYHGRSLRDQDVLECAPICSSPDGIRTTPVNLRPHYSDDYLLRVTPGPEANSTDDNVLEDLCRRPYTVSARTSRMGSALNGTKLSASGRSSMQSAAVFPGTVQLPPDGQPYLLGPDAQTTGGYLRIAQVVRADRHLIGQLRPNSRVRFALTTPEQATEIYRQKLTLLVPWLGRIKLW